MSCSNQNQGCGRRCQEAECEPDSGDLRKPIRFFLIVGVASCLLVILLVVFFPGAVLTALAAFMWVLGAKLLGKDLP